MRLLSWNIQSTKGCDQIFDINRIIKDIESFGKLDVICLQEVSRHLSSYNNDDQKALFENNFSNYFSAWAPGFSCPSASGKHQEFGNLTLVKKGTLLDQRAHQLPMPDVSPTLQMPRTAIETTIRYHNKSITILNTHLAYHSDVESRQQVEYLTRIREQTLSRAQSKTISATSPNNDAYQSAQTGQYVLLCGDLNIPRNSSDYSNITQNMTWLDCADIALCNAKNSARQPTCGIFDTELWPEGPHTRDYFLSSSNLNNHIENFEVNTSTIASDHQPICLTLKD